MEAKVLFDYDSSADDEVTIHKNELVKVLRCDFDQNWLQIEKGNLIGLAPVGYLELAENSWYVGKLARIDAERFISRNSFPDGAFIVRDSESTPGDFAITFKYGSAKHLKILRVTGGKFCLFTDTFDSINELLEFYSQNYISTRLPIEFVNVHPSNNFVKANHDYLAETDEELTIRKGDIITVLDKSHAEWWMGILNGSKGIFPVNHSTSLVRSNSITN